MPIKKAVSCYEKNLAGSQELMKINEIKKKQINATNGTIELQGYEYH